MFHTLAAKALIRIMDTKVSIETAINAVLNRMPAGLKRSMLKTLTTELELIIHGEIIELTEEDIMKVSAIAIQPVLPVFKAKNKPQPTKQVPVYGYRFSIQA